MICWVVSWESETCAIIYRGPGAEARVCLIGAVTRTGELRVIVGKRATKVIGSERDLGRTVLLVWEEGIRHDPMCSKGARGRLHSPIGTSLNSIGIKTSMGAGIVVRGGPT
jgi:hypothetical protein